MKRLKPRPLAIALACLGTATVHAQTAVSSDTPVTELPSIVVSASKRGETLDKIAAAVSVADREQLDDRQITSTLELDRVFPELHTSHGGTFMFPIITVRGMSSIQDLYSPALTIYVDGVPQLATFATQSLLGVEQVELLKGPQGTLYGRSAQGGVLNIVTRQPDNTPQFVVRSGVSGSRGYHTQAEASGPLVQDVLYGSVSLLGNKIGGDLKSEVIGSNHLGGVRTRAGNVKLRLAPTGSAWEMGLSAGRDCATGDQEAYAPFDDIKPRRVAVRPDLPEAYRSFYQRRCANSVAANGQYDWDDWRLSVTLGNHHMHSYREWVLDAGFPQFTEHWKQNTQELRLATRGAESGASSPRAWDAVFGLYRQDVDLSRRYLYDFVIPGFFRVLDSASSNNSQSLAAFGDVTWHVTTRFDLTGGLRASRDRANTDFRGEQMSVPFAGRTSTSENTWLGHAAARYEFSPQWSGYVNIAQGYKPRGFNNAPSSLADAQGYGRERSISYETGARYSGQDVRASVALYRIDSKDIQLYGDDGFGMQTLRNMGDTRSIGVELNAEWDITRQWTLAAGGYVNDAHFRRIDPAACAGCKGNDVPAAPRYGMTLTAKGNLLLGDTLLRPQLTVRRTGAQYFDNANTLRQKAYTLVDAALAWHPTDAVELALYAHNLFDKTYRNYGFAFGPLGNFAQIAPGRTVGMTATWRY